MLKQKNLMHLLSTFGMGVPKLFLRQGLNNSARAEKVYVLTILHNVVLTEVSDSALWHRHQSGHYFVKSAYDYLNFRGGGGVKIRTSESFLVLSVPLKLKLFFWLVIQDTILTKLNL
jgi:hypothetical protein